MIHPQRGHVYRMEDPEYGRLHCLAIAVQEFPGMENSFQAIRVTVTGQRHDFPLWIRMHSGDPCAGYVVVHDLDRVDTDELTDDCGPLSSETLFSVEQALKKMLRL